MCLIHIKCRLNTFPSILPICTKLLQYNCKLWSQRWQHFATGLQQHQETQIYWPSLLVIEITQKPCKTAIMCYPPPSRRAALPINKSSLNPLPTIPLPLLPVLTPCSHSHTFLVLCLGALLPKDGDGRRQTGGLIKRFGLLPAYTQ